MAQNPSSSMTNTVAEQFAGVTIESVNGINTSTNKNATVYRGDKFSMNGVAGTDNPNTMKYVIASVLGTLYREIIPISYPVSSPDSGSWAVDDVLITSFGEYTIEVDPEASGTSDKVTVQVLSRVSVELIGSSSVNVTPFKIQVAVWTNGSTVTNVQYSWDGVADQPLTPGQPDWTAQINLPSTVPGAGVNHTLALKATDQYGVVDELNVTIKAVDNTPPGVTILSPANSLFVPGTEQQAHVDVSVAVTDSPPTGDSSTSYLGSGIQTILWSVNGAIVNTTTVAGAPQSGKWSATLPLQPLDIQPQQITVTAIDLAGNSTQAQCSVTVALPLHFNDLSEQTYLRDLIDFACLRLKTSQINVANITPGHLQEAFHQDFEAIWKGASDVVSSSVHILRLVVASLFDYLRKPTGKAPIAHWPLTKATIGSNANPTATDIAGTGDDGTVQGVIAWEPDRLATPSNALTFDGASTYVQVGNPTLLVVQEQLTLTAWINPTTAQQNGVIAGKDQQYLLARFADGSIQFAMRVAVRDPRDPTFFWVNSGLTAPAGQWSHVALVCDGQTVRVYLNGLHGYDRVYDPAHDEQIWLGAQATDFRIGGQQSATAFFKGAISDVMLYDRAISAYDIALLVNTPPPQDEVWIDDALPKDAQPQPAEDGWNWVASNPTPYHGSACHQSQNLAGFHQHFVFMPHEVYLVNRGDRLFTYIYLDAQNPPDEVMLQWWDIDGGWEHRAFWGQDSIPGGNPSTDPGSHHRMGDLPTAGQWVRLEIPAAAVGLEDVAVQGFAFTLHNGRAAWDYSGKVSWTSQVAASGSTAAAYQALLLALGTSYDELRLTRSASSGARTSLASRLGFDLSLSRPDELDQLLKGADTITDTDLETLFGLLPADASVLSSPVAIPYLLMWSIAKLRKVWQAEDLGQGAADFRLPIVDPDIVQLSELLYKTAGQPAFDLWQSRSSWIEDEMTRLAKVRAGQSEDTSDAAALNAVIGAVPTLAGVNLDNLQQQLDGGYQISNALGQCHLTMVGFRRIMELRALAAGGLLESSEWNDVYAILAQVEKVTAYPQWRLEENSKGLLLSPDAFTLAPPGASVTLLQWRASWDARLAWADRLQARSLQLADIDHGLQEARFAAEEASLPLLRDALVIGAIDYDTDVSDQLTAQLFIDVKSGASLKTTLLDQAIETLQSGLGAIHTGAIASNFDVLPQNPAANWALSELYQDFETEWNYMGSYAGWSGAMTTYFFPENVLDPSLLGELDTTDEQAPSGAFQTLVSDAQPGGPFDPQKEANQLWKGVSLPTGVTLPQPLPKILQAPLSPNDLVSFRQWQQQLVKQPPQGLPIPGSYADQKWEWMRELFFLGPLQLALTLQRLGRYQEALDWLRTIYDHNGARSTSSDISQDQRAIFVGFSLDQGDPTQPPPSLTRPSVWLINDLNPHQIVTTPGRVNTHLRYTLYTTARCLLDFADAEFTKDTPESRAHARELYLEAERVLSAPQIGVSSAGVPPNPLRDTLRGRASTNLTKLHVGLNIAGIQRPLGPADDPLGIPPPTPYRYATLASRAQQLLASTQTVEQQYLAALQNKDNEQEKFKVAGQTADIAASHATEMQDQATAAGADIQVFTDQQTRASKQAQTYSDWLAQGPNDYEHQMLNDQLQATAARDTQTSLQATAAAAGAWSSVLSIDPGKLVGASWLATVASSADIGAGVAGVNANDAELNAQQNAFYGSLERQMDGWTLNQSMATWDAAIAGDQITAATDRQKVATDEANIATTQAANAVAQFNFLSTKFTNVNLYNWMVDVLGPLYRHQLQTATATALLAQRQLAFERQQRPPTFIKPDYVVDATASNLTAAQSSSGLTGSARLLSDLNDLNDYAYSTDQRKLQLMQSFSLAQLAPIDFILFRQSGNISFTIPLPLFDQSFPGHYLRLIRRIRISIVGLIPPTPGIRATLTSSGISSVVVPGDTFQTLRIARSPETVSYTSPVNATGTFDLDAQPDLMNSFEGNGVDMAFRLTMPKAANPFNYGSLADVIVIYEYTALPSADYARQVIRRMPNRTSNAIDFSIRQDFPDAWYTLLAQVQSIPVPATLSAQLSLSTRDLPPNLSGFKIEQVVLMVLRPEQPSTTPVPVKAALTLTNGGQPLISIQTAQAASVDDIISTRSSASATWNGLLNQDPTGTWVLTFANDDTITGQALQSGDITDIVLVLTYGGDLPPWPTP